MKWRRRRPPADVAPAPAVDSERAIADAQRRLEEVRRRAGEVDEVARSLRSLRMENHIAVKFRRALGGQG